MLSIDPFKYDMLSDKEKSAYISPYLDDYGYPKIKRKKNRKNENCRTERTLELFPSD